MKENLKETQAQQDGKAMTQFIPAGLIKGLAKVFWFGAVVRKRGRFNWRKDPIKASAYWGAIERHMDDWKCGEDLDPDTGVSHLQHVVANCMILMDASNHKSLIDDRDEIEMPQEFSVKCTLTPEEIEDIQAQLQRIPGGLGSGTKIVRIPDPIADPQGHRVDPEDLDNAAKDFVAEARPKKVPATVVAVVPQDQLEAVRPPMGHPSSPLQSVADHPPSCVCQFCTARRRQFRPGDPGSQPLKS